MAGNPTSVDPSADAALEAVLIPVKSFASAKERLAPLLDAQGRAELARELAERVVHFAAPRPVSIVCDDEEVAAWARSLGADVIWAPGKGLNLAVAFGVAELESRGSEMITIAHGDILDPSSLSILRPTRGITLVPDRSDDGTNVICLPAGTGFTFSYGPGSFRRHLASAHGTGLEVTVLRDTMLGHDVDRPGDLPQG